MDYIEQAQATKAGQTSPDAIHHRLVAIRKMTNLTSKEIAKNVGLKYTTFISQEKAGAPSVKLMTYYLKAFGVDYNFIIGGDASRLPTDVLQAILAAVSELESK